LDTQPRDEGEQDMRDGRQLNRERLITTLLICFHIVICCVSLVYITELHDKAHIIYDPARLPGAAAVIAAIAPVLFLFVFARFTFGYFVGFYFYTMIVGYLWINYFSDFSYNHPMAGLSAAGSAVAFLLPALFISWPVRPVFVLSQRGFDRLLTLIVLLSVATIAVSANYNFRFVAPGDASDLRGDIFPGILKYLIEITSSTLLPFLFACFVARGEYWRAGAILFLLLLFYPIAMKPGLSSSFRYWRPSLRASFYLRCSKAASFPTISPYLISKRSTSG
jgi:hypothetical protein